jgi:hypothetical protein
MVLLASEFDQSKFLNAGDLDGGERKFRIKSATAEDVGGEQKLVAWFTNDKKGLVLNKTNNRVLRAAFGNDTADWKDQIIIVFSMMVSMRGQMVPGLRVRIPPPKQTGTTTAATKPPKLSGNGQTAAVKPKVKEDDIIESPPAQSLSDEFNDEVDF